MKQLRLPTWLLGLPAVAALSLVAACGDDSSANGGNGGEGQGGGSPSSAGAGTSSTSGSSNKAGASSTGGSDSSGSGGFSTDLPGSKPLSDLTPDEVEQLCDDLDAYYANGSVTADLQELSCRLAGLLGAAFSGAETDEAAQTACQMAYDSCQAEPGESTWECEAPSADCTATIDELTACTNDSAESLRDATQQFPACSELTLDDLSASPGEEGTGPASCTTLQTKCPGGPTPPAPTM